MRANNATAVRTRPYRKYRGKIAPTIFPAASLPCVRKITGVTTKVKSAIPPTQRESARRYAADARTIEGRSPFSESCTLDVRGPQDVPFHVSSNAPRETVLFR